MNNRENRTLKRETRSKLIAYAFILPALLFFLFIVAYPLFTVLWDSFQIKNLINPETQGFAGLDNYISVLQNPNFIPALWNTIGWTVLSVTGEYVLGITSALALNQKIKGRAIFRGIIIIPWVVPIVIAGMTWTWMLTPDYGVLNIWMADLGLIDEPYYWLGEKDTSLLTVVIVNIWRSFPFYTICFLAALQAVNREMVEAAAIDGAGIITRFRKIILPELKSVSMVLIFIHVIWTFINFDFIWIMTQGGPARASETLPIMIYKFAMEEFNVGIASALSSMMLAFMLLVFIMYYLYTSTKNKG
ncbi:carbohydrate ABC transporter permease [Salibacterium aidingense]|uniref:carbohydrate ABC transporter permease n=1 Tax=Salibacterium aidingense TaxID=384933 RepID=UPI003BD41FB5